MKPAVALECLAVVAAVLLLFAGEAHAYLDPGSGSYLLQLLLGAILAAGFTVRLYWARVKAFFRRGGKRPAGE